MFPRSQKVQMATCRWHRAQLNSRQSSSMASSAHRGAGLFAAQRPQSCCAAGLDDCLGQGARSSHLALSQAEPRLGGATLHHAASTYLFLKVDELERRILLR